MPARLAAAAAACLIFAAPAGAASTVAPGPKQGAPAGADKHKPTHQPTHQPKTAPAGAGWTAEQALSRPVGDDLFPPALAITPSGSVLIGYGVTDEDADQNAYGELLSSTGTVHTVRRRSGSRSHRKTTTRLVGRLGTEFGEPTRVPGAQRVLAVGALGKQPVLIAGTSPVTTSNGTSTPQACCSDAAAAGIMPDGQFTTAQTLTTALGGPAAASVVEEGDKAVAVIASSNGIWTSLGAAGSGAFGTTDELTPISGNPPVLASGAIAGGRSIVIWTTPRHSVLVPTEGQTVYYAIGSPGALPQARRQVAFQVRAGKSVDQLALANHGSVTTLAWVESWYDTKGAFHSQVFASDLRHGRFRFRPISSKHVIATQVSFAGSGRGREAIAWQGCDSGATTCTAQAVLRSPHGEWGHARALGTIDTAAAPSAVVTTAGTALVGWIHGGQPLVAEAAVGDPKFEAVHALDGRASASNLTLTGGPLGYAAAVWDDGSATQSVHASFFGL